MGITNLATINDELLRNGPEGIHRQTLPTPGGRRKVEAGRRWSVMPKFSYLLGD